MDHSILMRLPRELRDNVYRHIFNASTDALSYVLEYSNMRNTEKSTINYLAAYYPIILTSRQLQHEFLSSFLEKNDLIERIIVVDNHSDSSPSSEYPEDHVSMTLLGRSRTYSKNPGTCRVRTNLPIALARLPEQYRNMIRNIGIILVDGYLHLRQGSRYLWDERPLEILDSITVAVACCDHAKRMFAKYLHRPSDKLVLQYRYILVKFSDGNPVRPVKRALRNAPIRDTITVQIFLNDKARSLARLEEACRTIQRKQDEITEAIVAEMILEEHASNAGPLDGRNNPQTQRYLHQRDRALNLWIQRLRIFHLALIEILMLTCEGSRKKLSDFVDLTRLGGSPMTAEQHIEASLACMRESSKNLKP
ncbi:hypothetical protein MBLNU459_g4737t1 [Dothideomycetes sp. NU459]